VGNLALAFSGTGTDNIAVGANAGSNVTTASNVICIGTNVAAANASNTCFIGNIFGVTTGMDALPVFIDVNGQLGTIVSSRRFKKDIQPMDKASEAILALKPVTFHYKADSKSTSQVGLIAEDVAKVNTDLVVRDKDGKPYSVRYDQVNAMLLNEFLKAHREIEEQQARITQLDSKVAGQETRIAQQEKGIEVLAAQLKEQAEQIQNVATQLELTRPTPRMAVNKP
jgi:trimeric autotransporter adhesin